MDWQDQATSCDKGLTRLLWRCTAIAAFALLAGCSSGEPAMVCQGQLQTLDGRMLSNLDGEIVDRFSSFRVTLPDGVVESGPLHSADRQKYVPSAVTQGGWLALRLSDTRFMVVNAPQDKVFTFSCPSRSI